MCLLILNKRKEIPREHLYQGFISNSDGAGIGYIEDNMLKVAKFDTFKKFYKKYVKIRKNNPYPMILHFRLTSAGESNEMNIHPFFINKDMIFAHNGHMGELRDVNEVYSDTYILRLLLKKSEYDMFNDEEINKMLEFVTKICNVSRFVFLRRDGKYYILNEKAGIWEYDEDTWYSNSSYKSYGSIYKSKCNIGIKETNNNRYNNSRYNRYNYDYDDDYMGYYGYDNYYFNDIDKFESEDTISDNQNNKFLYEYDKVFLKTSSLDEIIRFYKAEDLAEYYQIEPNKKLDRDTIDKILKDLIEDRAIFNYYESEDIFYSGYIINEVNDYIESYGDINFIELYNLIVDIYEQIEGEL